MAKATLKKMQKDLEDAESKGKSKASQKEKEIKTTLEAHIPRGERSNFLKITLTIPAELLTELRALGMRRKAEKMKDTDTSSLIREAVTDFLNKHRSN